MRESHEKAVQGSHGHGDGGVAAASGGDRGRGILSSSFLYHRHFGGDGVRVSQPAFVFHCLDRTAASVGENQAIWMGAVYCCFRNCSHCPRSLADMVEEGGDKKR